MSSFYRPFSHRCVYETSALSRRTFKAIYNPTCRPLFLTEKTPAGNEFLNGWKVWKFECFCAFLSAPIRCSRLHLSKNSCRQVVGSVRYLNDRVSDKPLCLWSSEKESIFWCCERSGSSAAGPTLPKLLGFFFYHDGPALLSFPGATFLRFLPAGF